MSEADEYGPGGMYESGPTAEPPRYVTPASNTSRSRADTDSTASEPRFRLFRLCPCPRCEGTGKAWPLLTERCPGCRGEGRVRQEVATAATPADVGVALVTLGREGEFQDCPFGLLDSEGETGKKWLVLPWFASPRNVSDAGRVLAKSKGREKS